MSSVNNRMAAFVGFFTAANSFTNVYGAARSLLALSSLLTLVSSNTFVLFRPATGQDVFPTCSGFSGKISLYCLLDSNLEIAKWIAIVILVAVVIGYWPQLTGILHWWISYSFVNSAVLVDGGDQVISVLAFFLIPITLADPRKSHWMKPPGTSAGLPYRLIIANTSITVIRIQVAVIYLHSAVAKCAVTEWQNGTALYYWFTDPMFGLSSWLKPVVMPMLVTSVSVTLWTWSIVLLEFLLFAGLIANKKIWPILLWAGISFHIGIALVHGLTSFAMAMSAALILFLRPAEQVFFSGGARAKASREKKPVQILAGVDS
jgi:antimicrobial peptide system SdpB family protein